MVRLVPVDVEEGDMRMISGLKEIVRMVGRIYPLRR